MRCRRLSPIAVAVFCLACAPQALARTVFKCVDAHGNLALQDVPCPAGSRETREELEVPPDPPQRSTFDTVPTPPTQHVEAPKAASPQPPPETAQTGSTKPGPTPVFFCTRAEDGTRYVSTEGKPPARWVPAGILGAPARGLAQTYGPGGGAGLSAPGMSKPKETRAPPDGIARDYVEVADECTEASPAQTCDYLRDQLDDVEHRLRRAFSDQRAVLEPRRDKLRQDLEDC